MLSRLSTSRLSRFPGNFFFRSVQSSGKRSKVVPGKNHYLAILQRFENKAGVVSREDLKKIFDNLLGYVGNEQSMGNLLGSLDVKKKGIVDHDSLMVYFEKMKLPKSEEIKILINRAKGKKERFGKDDLRTMLGWKADTKWMYYDPREDSVNELLNDGIKVFDSNRDGLLSLEELVDMYSCYLFVAAIVSQQ